MDQFEPDDEKSGHTKHIFACFASPLRSLRSKLLIAKAAEHAQRAQSDPLPVPSKVSKKTFQMLQ